MFANYSTGRTDLAEAIKQAERQAKRAQEYAQVQAQAAAAKNAAVHHAIWSTLEDTRKWVPLTDNRMPTLMGKYKVPHFDAKGEADESSFQLLGIGRE